MRRGFPSPRRQPAPRHLAEYNYNTYTARAKTMSSQNRALPAHAPDPEVASVSLSAILKRDRDRDVSDKRLRAVRDLTKGTIQEAIVALFQAQNMDERLDEECHTVNQIGFSRGTVHWGTRLAQMVIDSVPWSEENERKARTIIAIHRRQLEKVGIVPKAD